jgi:hypothetical protein
MFTRNPAGFTLTYENGYEVSVQWSGFHSCSIKGWGVGIKAVETNLNASATAEVAVFHSGITVYAEGWKTVEELTTLLARVSCLSGEECVETAREKLSGLPVPKPEYPDHPNPSPDFGTGAECVHGVKMSRKCNECNEVGDLREEEDDNPVFFTSCSGCLQMYPSDGFHHCENPTGAARRDSSER